MLLSSRRLALELRAKAAELATMSERFAAVGRRANMLIRRRLHGSYAICYSVDGPAKQVVVIRVLHSARDVNRLLFPAD